MRAALPRGEAVAPWAPKTACNSGLDRACSGRRLAQPVLQGPHGDLDRGGKLLQVQRRKGGALLQQKVTKAVGVVLTLLALMYASGMTHHIPKDRAAKLVVLGVERGGPRGQRRFGRPSPRSG